MNKQKVFTLSAAMVPVSGLLLITAFILRSEMGLFLSLISAGFWFYTMDRTK